MTKEDIKTQFGRSARAYVDSEIHKKGGDLKKLVEITSFTGQESVLDIATGGGHTANALASNVKEVTALDLTPEMLREAETFIKGQGHTNVRFIAGDAEQLPFAEEEFDIVTCRIAAHHFGDVEKFVQEVHRVLKTGGQFLLDDNVVPEEDSKDVFYNTIEKKRDYSHNRAFKKSEWLRLIEMNGFSIEETHRVNKEFNFDSWCERMNLPYTEKKALNSFIIQASENIRKHFHVMLEEDQNVVSFKGEAMLLKAIKI